MTWEFLWHWYIEGCSQKNPEKEGGDEGRQRCGFRKHLASGCSHCRTPENESNKRAYCIQERVWALLQCVWVHHWLWVAPRRGKHSNQTSQWSQFPLTKGETSGEDCSWCFGSWHLPLLGDGCLSLVKGTQGNKSILYVKKFIICETNANIKFFLLEIFRVISVFLIGSQWGEF